MVNFLIAIAIFRTRWYLGLDGVVIFGRYRRFPFPSLRMLMHVPITTYIDACYEYLQMFCKKLDI